MLVNQKQELKLIDFGFATDKLNFFSPAGTLTHMSPCKRLRTTKEIVEKRFYYKNFNVCDKYLD